MILPGILSLGPVNYGPPQAPASVVAHCAAIGCRPDLRPLSPGQLVDSTMWGPDGYYWACSCPPAVVVVEEQGPIGFPLRGGFRRGGFRRGGHGGGHHGGGGHGHGHHGAATFGDASDEVTPGTPARPALDITIPIPGGGQTYPLPAAQLCALVGGTWDPATSTCTSAVGPIDPASECVKKGGTWDSATGVCILPVQPATPPAPKSGGVPGWLLALGIAAPVLAFVYAGRGR